MDNVDWFLVNHSKSITQEYGGAGQSQMCFKYTEGEICVKYWFLDSCVS